MNDQTKLTLIVVEDQVVIADSESKEEDFKEQAKTGILERLHLRRTKEVDLNRLREGLERVQAQVDQLLGGVNKSSVAGFRLSSVEVSLAISAEGSIGVATAGVEASMSLSFDRVEGSG
jgi:hypothetical protein